MADQWDAIVAALAAEGAEVTEERRILYPLKPGPWLRPAALKETSYTIERRYVITTPAEKLNLIGLFGQALVDDARAEMKARQ